jgi:hypothetical protein
LDIGAREHEADGGRLDAAADGRMDFARDGWIGEPRSLAMLAERQCRVNFMDSKYLKK